MNTAAQQIDSYIEKAAPFAQEICKSLRKIIHKTSSDIEEAVKWGSPMFTYNGKNLCLVWAFKHHASIVFPEGALINDKYKLFNQGEDNLKGRGIQFKGVSEVDEKKIMEYLHQAMRNIDEGKSIKVPVSKDKTVNLPDWYKKVLQKEKLLEKYESQIYTYRKGYLQWIEGAKQPQTKEKRINQMISEVRGGKIYMGMKR